MKKIAFLFFLLIICYGCTKKDVFEQHGEFNGQVVGINTYGGSNNESLNAVKTTLDGGYITVGHTQSSDADILDKSNESYDYWVVRFNADDEILWNKTFGGSDDDRAQDVLVLEDGSFLITGFSRSADTDVSENAGNYDFWLIKIDNDGNLLWEQNFGFSGVDQSYALLQTSDGHFLIGGTLDVTASGGEGNSKTEMRHAGGDYWLIKVDPNGNKVWSRYFGGLFTDTLYGIEESQDLGYILVGSSDSDDTNISNNLGSYDYWAVKISQDGDLIWEKSYGGSQIDEAFSIIKNHNNEFLIAGNSRSFDTDVRQNNGSSDAWVINIDEEGTLRWAQNYGGSSFEDAKKIISSRYGGFYVVGSSRSSDIDVNNNNGNKDGWLFKIDDMGNLLWQQSFGGSQLEELNGITELADGALIAVGEAWSNDFDIDENKGFSDALILKIQ